MTDKVLPSHSLPTSKQTVQLKRLRADFARAYKPRKFTKIEKEMLLGELINFAKFRFEEIKYMSKKSWSNPTKQQNR